MTWPLFKATLKHWESEPPLQVLVARYFKIPPRERVRMYSREEAAAIFLQAGFTKGGG